MSRSNKPVWLVFKVDPNIKIVFKHKSIKEGIYCKHLRFKTYNQILRYFKNTSDYVYVGNNELHWCLSYDEAQEKIAELRMWDVIL